MPIRLYVADTLLDARSSARCDRATIVFRPGRLRHRAASRALPAPPMAPKKSRRGGNLMALNAAYPKDRRGCESDDRNDFEFAAS
eukprot:7261334-Prymnesium_polylepis.1